MSKQKEWRVARSWTDEAEKDLGKANLGGLPSIKNLSFNGWKPFAVNGSFIYWRKRAVTYRYGDQR